MYKNMYAIVKKVEGDKETIVRCPDCQSPFIDTNDETLYKNVAQHVGILPEWYMVRFTRAEEIDIQPTIKVGESANV